MDARTVAACAVKPAGSNRPAFLNYDHGSEVPIGVAHADSIGSPADLGRGPFRLKPREWRVPGYLNVAGKKCFHLALVGRVQDVVESEAAVFEVALKAVPDRHDFRVIGHGPEKQGKVTHQELL